MESNEALIASILESLGSSVKKTARGYVTAACPFAAWRHENGIDRNPSFGVVYDAGQAKHPVGHAHCFSCGYSGDLRDIVSLYYVWQVIGQKEFAEHMEAIGKLTTGGLPLSLSAAPSDDPFPADSWLTGFPPVSKSTPDAVTYLDARGISGETVKFFDLRFDPQRWRVAVPLHDRAHRFRGLIGRTMIPNPTGPRYFYYPYKDHPPKGFTWFNEHNLDLSKPVLVVEGVFDAMKAWPVYKNVTAALSVSFRPPGMGWHTQVQRWVTMFDVGKGGGMGRERLDKLIKAPTARSWHLMPPPGRKDPGESTPDEILAQLNTLRG